MSKPAFLILGLVFVLASGCGDDSSDSGPTEHQVFLVQRSSDAAGAVGQVVEASNAEIVAGAPDFNLSASVDVVLDLDAQDGNGNDRFPNATGQVHVIASGTVNGTSQSGDASYSVSVAAETDVLATNPDTGGQVLIPMGSSWSYELDVVWSVTDSNNWTVTATANAQVGVSDMVVTNGASVQTIDVQGQREVEATLTRTAGQLTFQRSVVGALEITVDDGITVETVVIAYDNAGQVTISVDGGVFGPMAESEARALFRSSIN